MKRFILAIAVMLASAGVQAAASNQGCTSSNGQGSGCTTPTPSPTTTVKPPKTVTVRQAQGQLQGQVQGQVQGQTANGGAGGAGGNATGGNASSYSSGGTAQSVATNAGNTVTITGPAVPSTTRIENTPDVGAVLNSPSAPCRVAHGGSVTVPGLGIGLGSSTLDEGCDAREDSRHLFNIGERDAALRRLCAKPEMAKALGEVKCPPPPPAEPAPVSPGA